MLRLLVAALAGLLTFVATVYLTSKIEEPALVGVAGAILSFVGVPALVLHLLKPTGASESLRRAGQLREVPLEVVRAWQIAELEDEGLHFVLEASDGTNVFLSGRFSTSLSSLGCSPAPLSSSSLMTATMSLWRFAALESTSSVIGCFPRLALKSWTPTCIRAASKISPSFPSGCSSASEVRPNYALERTDGTCFDVS